jgi:hypothetical protein
MDIMQIKDVKTRQLFKIDPSLDRITLKTRDGVKVKLHPTIIQFMVKKNGTFQGTTVFGGREMVKLT